MHSQMALEGHDFQWRKNSDWHAFAEGMSCMLRKIATQITSAAE